MNFKKVPVIGKAFDIVSTMTGLGRKNWVEEHRNDAKEKFGWNNADIEKAEYALGRMNMDNVVNRSYARSKGENVGGISEILSKHVGSEQIEKFFQIELPEIKKIKDHFAGQDDNFIDHLIEYADNMPITHRCDIAYAFYNRLEP